MCQMERLSAKHNTYRSIYTALKERVHGEPSGLYFIYLYTNWSPSFEDVTRLSCLGI